jgi:hypothetical protein
VVSGAGGRSTGAHAISLDVARLVAGRQPGVAAGMLRRSDCSSCWLLSLARQDGLLAAIGAAGVNRAEISARWNLADHQDVRGAATKTPQIGHLQGTWQI